MIYTTFSENFLPENKLCGWLFTDLHNTYAFSWPLANFPDFPLVKKNHISFCNHIYNYLYYSFSLIMSVHDNTVIDTFWLCCDCPSSLSLRSRRLEVVGTRKNGRGRRRHACLPRAPVLSFTHYFQAPAMQATVASNNVQTIGTIIWKCYPDDRKWLRWLRRPLSIVWIELSSTQTIGRIV